MWLERLQWNVENKNSCDDDQIFTYESNFDIKYPVMG